MVSRVRRKSMFDYPNAVIVIWMVAMFIGFGLFSNLYDNEGVIYNLVQGAFIALFVGTVMYLIRLVALRRRRETVIIEN